MFDVRHPDGSLALVADRSQVLCLARNGNVEGVLNTRLGKLRYIRLTCSPRVATMVLSRSRSGAVTAEDNYTVSRNRNGYYFNHRVAAWGHTCRPRAVDSEMRRIGLDPLL